MKRIGRFLCAGVFPAFCFSLAAASPTANEFLPCHQLSSSMLSTCLDQNPGYVAANCWETARRANDACYATVRKSHQPDRDRIEAEKRARQKDRQ